MADALELPPLEGVDTVNHVLEVCGFNTDVKRTSIHEEGFDTVTDFGIYCSAPGMNF